MQLSWVTQVLLYSATGLLSGATATPSKDFEVVKRGENYLSTKATGLVGVSHGYGFDDESDAKDRVLKYFDFTGCGKNQHLTYMAITYEMQTPVGPNQVPAIKTTHHGSQNGDKGSFKVPEGEVVTQVEVTTWQAKTGFLHKSRRTRVGSITIKTDKNTSYTCGASSSSDPKQTWSFEHYKLSHFFGSAGDAIDALGAVFQRA